MPSRFHHWVLCAPGQVIFLVGLALVMAGVVCLFLSGVVAASGSWWQGTLDVFGVGFVVGGLVDAVAVTLLNWRTSFLESRASSGQALRIPGTRGDGDRFRWDVDASDAVMQSQSRLEVQHTGQLLALLAGLALIVAGVVCLFLSGVVAASGSWWQGTLDAFGVGFVVGGLVDVAAASPLNRVVDKAEAAQPYLSLSTPRILGYIDDQRIQGHVGDQRAPRTLWYKDDRGVSRILGYTDESGAVMPIRSRSQVLAVGQLVVLLAGLGLIVAGVACLFLAGRIAASGSWWHGTLSAFGVGFVVGGLVDAVAASLFNRVVNGTDEARQNSLRARRILAEISEPGAVARSRARLWVLGSGQLVVLLAGLALIVAGVVCLFLSGMVAATGSWWQGTLGPFGVGFVLGGLVDVVAVSLLSWMVNGADIVRQNSQQAMIIYFPEADEPQKRRKAAAEALAMCDGQIFDDYHDQLLKIAMTDVSSAGTADGGAS